MKKKASDGSQNLAGKDGENASQGGQIADKGGQNANQLGQIATRRGENVIGSSTGDTDEENEELEEI